MRGDVTVVDGVGVGRGATVVDVRGDVTVVRGMDAGCGTTVVGSVTEAVAVVGGLPKVVAVGVGMGVGGCLAVGGCLVVTVVVGVRVVMAVRAGVVACHTAYRGTPIPLRLQRSYVP